MKQFPDGAFFVEGVHSQIHQRKLETKVSDDVFLYIEENLHQSPEDIFNQLVSRRDMENVTQSQIYYHRHKATVQLYRCSLDQIESTVR